MARVALIGGGGFIGKNLAEAFAKAGHDVRVIARTADVLPIHQQVASLDDTSRIVQLIEAHRSEVVIHLASGLLPSSNFASFLNEQQALLAPSYRLMNHCAERGLKFVLMSSGGTVYGEVGDQPVREDHPRNPKNYYAFSKLALEDYAFLCHRQQGLQYLVLRPSNPYGRYQNPNGAQGVVAVALGRALRGESIEVWGDGSVVRDYLDVGDLAQAVVALVEAGTVNTVLNIGSGIGHSLEALFRVVRQVTGQSLPIVYRPARGGDVRRIVLDTSALAKIIPWQPGSLESGVANFNRWIKDEHPQ
jgi:UDP-glucose 4-epimerase